MTLLRLEKVFKIVKFNHQHHAHVQHQGMTQIPHPHIYLALQAWGFPHCPGAPESSPVSLRAELWGMAHPGQVQLCPPALLLFGLSFAVPAVFCPAVAASFAHWVCISPGTAGKQRAIL